MRGALPCLWGVTVLVSGAMLVAAGANAARALSASTQCRSELDAISRQAKELVELRRQRADVPERPAGHGALASSVSAAMTRAGLAGHVLQSLSPEAKSQAAGALGSGLSRQRVTFTLANLSLPQVGKFLDAWRSAESDWVVSAIDLTPLTSRDTPPIGTDLPLRAVITIEGVFRDSTSKSETTSISRPGASR